MACPPDDAPPAGADEVRRAYDRAAPFYDAWLWQAFWQRNEWPIVRRLAARLAAAPPQARVFVDLGAGTGTYLRWLARDLGPDWRSIGVDLSAGMLAIARRRLGLGLGAEALLVQADARHLPIADGGVGLVLMNRVASHLALLDDAVAEIARLLAPGGAAIVSDLAPDHRYAATELPTADGKIAVPTHKHGVEDWEAAAQRHGLQAGTRETITAQTAAWLPEAALASIDRGSARPVAFVLGLRRA